MRLGATRLLGTVFCVLMIAYGATAGVPRLLDIQGRLTDDLGNTVADGDYPLEFRIYDAAASGTMVWSSGGYISVPVTGGVFTYRLGTNNPLPASVADYDSLWVAMELDGSPEMAPRIPLVAVMYALRAGTADYADTAAYALSSTGGGHWSVVDSVLTTNNYWGLTRGNSHNALYGAGAHTMVNLGHACTTGTSGQDHWHCAIGGGSNNRATGFATAIAGGSRNKALNNYSFIGGGSENVSSGWYDVIGGGDSNTVEAGYSAILGGYGNTISFTGHHSYLFGIRSTLTQDSTFMVDMPHIRFGNETDGYELPPGDGADGQILITDGSGQLSWSDVPEAVSHWSVVDSILLTNDYWGIGRGNVGSAFYGDSAHTNINFGVGCTVGTNFSDAQYNTIAGGLGNNANSVFTSVSGGRQNRASGQYSSISGGNNNWTNSYGTSIGGGENNFAHMTHSTIAGGSENATWNMYAFVGGGWRDSSVGQYSAVVGGRQNRASGNASFVGGGWENDADEFGSTVCGGMLNEAISVYSGIAAGKLNHCGNYDIDTAAFIGGGWDNRVLYGFGTIGGGKENYIIGRCATVAGGWENYTAGNNSAIGGGWADTIHADYGAIGGGRQNMVGDDGIDTAATIGGGAENTAIAKYATVGGGFQNEVQMACGTVGGGYSNSTRGQYSTIGGGFNNVAGANDPDDENYCTVGGGMANKAIADQATISGGRLNEVGGDNSFIGGGQKNYVEGRYSAILGGYADSIYYGANYSYLFGIDANLSEDSTFMVDMPHIRFGDEINGYEFPASDGTFGQILMTDGNGDLDWVGLSIPSNGWTEQTTSVVLNHSGDSVGIGTVDPEVKLHIFDSDDAMVRIETDGSGAAPTSQLQFATPGAGTAEIVKYNSGRFALRTGDGSDLQLGTQAGGTFTFTQGSSDVLRINNVRNVCIGHESAKNKLDVEGAAVIGAVYSGVNTAPSDGLLVQGKVGIGTTSPYNTLDVEGNVAIGSGYSGFYLAPTDGLIVEGNVGIGLTTPNRKLYVTENTNGVSFPLKLDNPHSIYGVSGTGILFSVGGDGGNQLSVTRGKGALAYTYDHTWNRGSFHFLQNTATNADNPTLADAVMTIKNNGNVGVGTNDPQDPLEVKGFIRTDGGLGAGGAYRFTEGGTLRWALLYRPWASHKLGFYDEQAGHWIMAFEQGTGEVGIGTDSPNYTLDVRGSIGNNTTLYHSDMRWKRDVSTITNALEKVLQLRGVTFAWRTDEFEDMQFPDGDHLGVIAQEVEAAIPELVHTAPDGFKSVEYANLTAVLIEAVKELQEKNEELQKRIEKLERAR